MTIEPWMPWLIAAVLLAVAEIVAPGVFLIWVAAAAAVTGLVTMLVQPSVTVQLLLFAAAALLATWGGRRWYMTHQPRSADPLLNDRAGRLVGETVLLTSAIVNGHGRARVADGEWSVRGPDAPAGTCLRVIGMEDGALVVRPLSALPGEAGSASRARWP